MAAPTFSQRVSGIVDPTVLFYYAVSSYVSLLVEALLQQKGAVRLSEIRSEAFSRFWQKITGPPDPNQPLQGSATLIPPLLSKAEGVVLELGPGNGSQIGYFTNPSIRKIYGAEPCIPLHPMLQESIERNNLLDKYEIIPAGAERSSIIPALRQRDLLIPGTSKGAFDTIVCVRVLCSVPRLSETVENIHDLLKPGGKLLVCEHVVNPWTSRRGSIFARLWQKLLTLMGWTYFVGDCHLERDTQSALIAGGTKKGGWEEVKLETHFRWSALPYVSGWLIKRSL